MSATFLYRVFVYGTLKTKQPNNYVLQDPSNGMAQFIGNGITKDRYPLVVASRYNIPFLLPFVEGKGKNIHGEVYSVDNKMLEILDDFEGHPTFYERQQIPISLRDRPELCWCYILQKCKPEFLQLPFMDNYDNNDPQGLKYVLSENVKDPSEIDLPKPNGVQDDCQWREHCRIWVHAFPKSIKMKQHLRQSELKGIKGQRNIHGEVYSVDDKMVENLGDFEGHPTFYDCQQVPILLTRDKPELCWCSVIVYKNASLNS